MTPAIHLALRFHTNFYHSYRGDSLDENGIGKDLRIITGILNDLDQLNAEGVPVHGTWDIENYYSLEVYMPRHGPELISRLQARVAAGSDAVEPMSWNNGIVSACTDEEFDQVVDWTVNNDAGSGVADLFDSWEPVVRPQEGLYTPSHLSRYPTHGIGAISLYYSTHPFNAFSNFIPPLPFEQQYNPVRVKSRYLPGSMTLLPAYNIGDLADHWLSLRRWVKALRRRQLAMRSPCDLLLTMDMDADDEFWAGMQIPILPKLLPTFDGLYRMVRSVSDLQWLKFTTPGSYLADHPPVGEIFLDQDTADGSFDGMSSWAEKWSNTMLWTRLQDARRLGSCARRLAGVQNRSESLDSELAESRRATLLGMSTTHFGLASPVMNPARLETGVEWCDRALGHARNAMAEAIRIDASARSRGQGTISGDSGALVFPREVDPEAGPGIGALVRYHATGDSASPGSGADPEQSVAPLGDEPPARTIIIRRRAVEALRRDSVPGGVEVTEDSIGNGLVTVRTATDGTVDLIAGETRINRPGFPRCAVGYAGRVRDCRQPETPVRITRFSEHLAALSVSGTIALGAGHAVSWTHRYVVAGGLPYFHVDVLVVYPATETQQRGKGFGTLGTSWDSRWREVMPWEFSPELEGNSTAPLRIWKHNFFGDITGYDLDYFRFSDNRNLDSFNNHITNGWVAAAGPGAGVLIAQSGLYDNSFAFCPMRLRHNRGRQVLTMNPFGTYYGKQWQYGTAVTGIGRFFSLRMADHLESYAPSYNGRTTRFSLMIAPYTGESPDEGTCADAMLFANPPVHTGEHQ